MRSLKKRKMDITEVSLIHHVAIVLLVLWILSSFNFCHPISYFMSLIYLFLVHERYVMRLRKKLLFEERRQANQRKVLSDSESVRWLNHFVEKMWPILMEPIASQKILLPIIPWFLDKYKPWTAKQALVQHLYLGRNAPVFTDMRVRESSDDDHVVMELGMNFLTAEDMSAVLAVQLRKRLGFGMWTKLHMTGLHIEGKVLVGVKFLRNWPFLGRLRLCFLEPPYVQMTVKPLFNHGVDVTELPGIAGWLDNLLSIAFEQTLVEPNMLVVDLEKFVSPQPENWFFVDGKEPAAFVKLEVIEGSDMISADLNGYSDPYVKGQLGPYRFRTKTQKKTLSPKWQEEYKIPICSWDSPNILVIEVCDKDHFVDDTLGDCSVNISDFRDGQRHSLWLPLENVKSGRLHLAITVTENTGKVLNPPIPQDEEGMDLLPFTEENGEKRTSFAGVTVNKDGHSSPLPSAKSPIMADVFDPINIEGQQETGIWVHQPGSQVKQTWEPRKGKSRNLGESNVILSTPSPTAAPGSFSYVPNDNSSADESLEGASKNHMTSFKKGLQKINSAFHKSPGKGHRSSLSAELTMSPMKDKDKDSGVRFIVEDTLSGPPSAKVVASSERNGSESPNRERQHGKSSTKSYLKQAGKSAARSLKQVISRRSTKKDSPSGSGGGQREIYGESDSFDDEPPLGGAGIERAPSAPVPRSSSGKQARASGTMKSANSDTMLNGSDKYHDCFVVEALKKEGFDKKDSKFS